MIKKSGAILLLTILLLTFSLSLVSAALTDNLKSLVDPANFGPATLRWLFLGLIALLIYSSLTYANFPENSGIRIIISIIVGLLATVLIANDELVASMQSYTALGIAFILFVPLMILAFFTFAVASKASPMGLVVQQIAWIIYSVYLFVRTGAVLLYKYGSTSEGISELLQNKFIDGILTFFGGPQYSELYSTAGSTTIIAVLFIVSIAVFVIFVLGNKKITHWFMEEKRGADVSRFQDTQERATEVEKARAKATR